MAGVLRSTCGEGGRVTPSRLEIVGVLAVLLGIAGTTAAAWMAVGVWLALAVSGVLLGMGGLAVIKAAAMSERGGK